MDIKKKKIGKNNNLPAQRNQVNMFPWDIWSDMDRFFTHFRNEFENLFFPEPHSLMTYNTYQPPLDLVDQGSTYEMHVDIPGVPKEKIDIEVTPTSIQISAEHEAHKEEKEENILKRERNSIKFYRTIEFPEEILTEEVEAEMQDGVLTVTLPKTEPNTLPKPKKVDVK